MATKKQKREAAMAKREQFMREQRENGLRAQKQDRHNREMQRQQFAAKGREINARYEAILAKHGMLSREEQIDHDLTVSLEEEGLALFNKI